MILFFWLAMAWGKEVATNEVRVTDAPDWLTRPRVEKVVEHILIHLDGRLQPVTVQFYSTPESYAQAQNLGPLSLAVTKYDGGVASVHLGPRVTNANFDEVFGHELVHVVIYQRYKDAVPKWLEEGLANNFSTKTKVDYKWLAGQPPVDDVHNLAHPFRGSADQIQMRYQASQAFAEMLAKKCDLEELLKLSVQRKMEDYMRSYCEITDLNKAYRDWIKAKSQTKGV